MWYVMYKANVVAELKCVGAYEDKEDAEGRLEELEFDLSEDDDRVYWIEENNLS